ncbi:unnamed protein product, partial [Closterium sp. NIES-53]
AEGFDCRRIGLQLTQHNRGSSNIGSSRDSSSSSSSSSRDTTTTSSSEIDRSRSNNNSTSTNRQLVISTNS